ncbi:beta-lactamase family protein, partial [Acidobacteria bacterium AH-259-A15]|nr:beta-lactamase family protein [Acidobacteria bacterium AH-259-A15]
AGNGDTMLVNIFTVDRGKERSMETSGRASHARTLKSRVSFIIVLWLTVSPSFVAGQALGNRLNKYLADLHQEGQFSGSVIVTKNDEVLHSKSYGLADVEHGVANTPQTRFRIGSITKQFTAMGIMILQERGRLSVTDTLGKHLTDIPSAWEGLTIHQLLTHTSGIMHSWALPGFRDTMMVPASIDEVLERYHDQPLLFTPGEDFQYSGVGYFLLAKLIEVISGKPYGMFLQEAVFAPLGMHDTGTDQPEVVLERRARGYVFEDGTLRNAPTLYIPILTGGGNLYSTVEDLARWDRALREKRLISPAGYKALYQPDLENYAYGWRVSEQDGRRVLGHGGGVPGFTSFILRVPDEELCVVVLTNSRRVQVRNIADRLAETVLQRE